MESPGMARTAGLRRYGGLGSRMPRSARLKLSGSPRSTWLYLARPDRLGRYGRCGRDCRLHPRSGGLRRYGGLGGRMARSARLKLSGSPRSTWLCLARPSGDAGLHLPGVRSYAGLELAGPGAGLNRTRSSRATGLDRTGMTRGSGLHLSGPAGRRGLKLSGPCRGSGGYRLSRQGGSHRTDLLIGRQLLNLPLLLRGQLHSGPGW